MNKKIFKDTLINMIASFLPIGILQLIVLPLLATRIESDAYGLALTLISLITLISSTFGNSLNNVRLLTQNEYQQKKETGDFNLLFILSAIATFISMIVGIHFYKVSLFSVGALLLVIAALLLLIREYYTVEFRLELNYKKVLISSLLLTIGYLLGVGLFFKTGLWQFVYTLGYFLSVVYILFGSRLIREPFVTTSLFKSTLTTYLVLIINTFILGAFNYIDRLFLYPVLGGTSVSIYYTATLFGKIVSMGITPITGVFLSYFTKMEKAPKKGFAITLLSAGGIGVIGYFAVLFLSKPVLSILYPQWVQQAMLYIPITTATAMVMMLNSVINPFLLSFCNTNWQLLISIVSLIIYSVLAFILMNAYGLLGFCIAILISNLIKCILMILIYCFTAFRKK